MSKVKQLLDALLCDIYGKQQQQPGIPSERLRQYKDDSMMATRILGRSKGPEYLQTLSIRKLIDICAILKVEIQLMGLFLEYVLIDRDRNRRRQEVLCNFVDAVLYVHFHDSHPKMRFSLSPPPPKAASVAGVTSPTNMLHAVNTRTPLNEKCTNASEAKGQRALSPAATAVADDAASDYVQWLHAMKLVARLPGGMPPEFRRKLWLSLADKYLKSKNVDWEKEEEKCFCEKWREDDEELGIQIVKDLHRTGSNLCTGPAGSINQAKLKRILLGYARYNPEVGYCQGFNMLGALILQVMDKEESESMKVMIYLVEGVLPPGYFCGSMGGLQADMGVFRELMQTKLPRLAKHLQKLQGPIENAYEPPLTNVFTMQWFLTMFCTCLPMSCVLRVWDLVLIEGSDVLLRTALVLWSLLEERVLSARTADDFYGKMGSFSSELLNGHLIDSNGLIEKVVQLGPIPDIQKLRDKHLYNIAPLRHKQGLQLYFDDEEPESDEDSRLAVATAWGIPWGRRGSQSPAMVAKQAPENKERIALDISLLKKQYDRLRERQRQAHIILTTACSTARQGSSAQGSGPNVAVPVNQLLLGRPAIVLNKGRRPGAPLGAIPPARKPSLPTVLTTKPPEKQLRRGETLHWRDTDLTKKRRDSLTWKEIKADRAAFLREGSLDVGPSTKLRTRMGKSDSSSYSEESEEEDGSSTDTSLCDEDDPTSTGDRTHSSSVESSPRRRVKLTRKQKELSNKLQSVRESNNSGRERKRPKSWAPTTSEIPFTLMTSDSPGHSGDEKTEHTQQVDDLIKEEDDSAADRSHLIYKRVQELDWSNTKYSPIAGDLATTNLAPLHIQTDILELPVITSTSQLSPMPDIVTYLNNTTISPLPTPKPPFLDSTNSLGSGDGDGEGGNKKYDVNDDGVTNQYFERVNSVERPTKLDLFYSLNEEDDIRNAFENKECACGVETTPETTRNDKVNPTFKPESSMDIHIDHELNESKVKDVDSSNLHRRMELLMDYSEKSSAAFIAEATSELSTAFKKEKTSTTETEKEEKSFKDVEKKKTEEKIAAQNDNVIDENHIKSAHNHNRAPLSKEHALSNASKRRRDPRRLTLTRSSTIEIEERFEALERRLSSELITELDNINPSNELAGHKEKPKRIPSTADLEERYNSLEKQLSIGKKVEKVPSEENVIKRKNIIPRYVDKTESTDSGVPISDMSDSENMPLEKPKRERIPSTAALEDRFNALERQMSSHSLPTKNAVDLRGDASKTDKDEAKDSKRKTKEKENQDSDISQPSSETKNVTEKSEDKSKDQEKPHLKKLPSTAELEDRFEALERKRSIQKTSPSKTKKEPPDDVEVVQHKEQKVTQTSERSSESNKEPNEIENELHQTKEQIDDVKTQKTIPVEEDKPQSKTLQKPQTVQEKPKESETPKKKSPPSTEELEKRFQALEKRMSKTNLEEEDEKETQQQQLPTKTEEGETEVNSVKKSTESAIKSCSENCENNNEKATEESSSTKAPTKEKDVNQTKQLKSIDAFNEKCKEISAEIVEIDTPSSKEEVPKSTSEEAKKSELASKRRASEPPSTEDLEKRYESLKRRMSSKTINEKTLTKSETVEEALERIEKEIIEETNEEIKSKDIESTPINDEATESKNETSKLPTTEDLESRYEALQQRSRPKKEFVEKSQEKKELKETSGEKKMSTDMKETNKKITKEKEETVKVEEQSAPKDVSANTENTKKLRKIQMEPSPSKIPNAPPMPTTKSPVSEITDNRNQQQQRALIQEFESKIKAQPNDENLKPSEINPSRKSPTPARKTNDGRVDETSETRADTAFYGRSENYESWQSKKVMVRRFSDLPSRADLENRLQFLENQLSKKFNKLRRASDSEVTSRKQLISKMNEAPSTSMAHSQGAPTELEKRVQALEKQLSENSLQLLEAMRAKTTHEVEAAEGESPRRLSTETIDATGKELVRYTHYGELEEADTHKPINISINIKMLLNKDADAKSKRKELNIPTTEELERRLEKLETQLKTPNVAANRDDIAVEQAETKDISHIEETKDVVEQNLTTTQTDDRNGKTSEPEMENRVVNGNQKPNKSEETVEEGTSNIEICEKCTKQALDGKKETDSQPQKSLKKQEISEEHAKVTEPSTKEHPKEERPEDIIRELQEGNRAKDTKSTAKTTKEISKTDNENKQTDVTNTKVEDSVQKTDISEELQEVTHAKDAKDTTEMVTEITKADKNNEQNDLSNTKAGDLIEKAEAQTSLHSCKELPQNMVINASDIGPVDPNNKTLVLLLDNEPKAVKVRRLTRANTEELEGLFQALEKQLSERNLVKTNDGKLKRADNKQLEDTANTSEEAKAISDLSKEIVEFAASDKSQEQKPQEEEYDWGPDPVKKHLKRKTVYLPSTKELEARFRSLERQIKFLEDVEKIDVEQRLNEIERKIKLQYSLSHEKDLSKFIELCEGKGLDEEPEAPATGKQEQQKPVHVISPHKSPERQRAKSPARSKARTPPHTSPARTSTKTPPFVSPTRSSGSKSPYTSPSRTSRHSPYTSPSRRAYSQDDDSGIPTTEDLEYRYRVLDLQHSKPKANSSGKSKSKEELKKQPIHPLEMLLGPSPDEIPTTGELEHRMRVLEEKRKTPSPTRLTLSTRSRSPTIDDIKRQKLLESQRARTPIHNLEALVSSPTRREPPTAEELEARMQALEKEHCFDFKTQKTYKEFNQKLKDVVSPSLSFEELKPTTTKSRETSPRYNEGARATTPKSPRSESHCRSTSPKVIRFQDEEEEYSRLRTRTESYRDIDRRMVGQTNSVLELIKENSKMIQRILQKTITDTSSIHSSLSDVVKAAAVSEGLDEMGSRLMRETSPLRRTGTHTGVPLRTDDNINERLSSIKNTIKSIETLCEEKPYRKEKCQRYIDSLFSDSLHFSKKTSLEDLPRSSQRDYTPSIRVSDHSQRPSEYYQLSRSIGSADSLRSTSPLRAASPLHHRSHRDLRRSDVSPRSHHRLDEEREEHESRH